MRIAAFTLVLLVVTACASAPIPARNPYANRPEAVQAGAKLFLQHCAACHGADASGHAAPSLRRAAVQSLPDPALFSFITNGALRRGMPSWAQLPDERRWQLIAYLRSLHDD